MATFPDVGQRLTDAFEFGLLLRIGAEVILDLPADLILGLILKTGVKPVHIRVSEEVGRERRRNTGRNAGSFVR